MKRNEILKDLMRDVYKRQSSVRAFRHFFIKYLQDQLIEGRFIGIELLKNLTHLNLSFHRVDVFLTEAAGNCFSSEVYRFLCGNIGHHIRRYGLIQGKREGQILSDCVPRLSDQRCV